ncbi:MAG: AAA family ATPase [Devosia nanyangense]|uniref:AAA family ATPase n=1 Tax=Devosia nanyangense TaxID=1228055 RepID=A0A933L2M4_9HYPH|nr:AAA family ATPase [Devosia nanyangense]
MRTCPNCQFSNVDSARFCSNCGNSLESQRPVEGERRFATVLFADVARSTSIAEQLDPEDWTLIMNGAFGLMNAAVSRYGGTVSRLMGDAVLALFGAPIAHEDDAERAVRAGLEIQQSAKEYAQTVKRRHGVDFDLRVGVNTGTAVLAFVGDAIKTEYTAMGDAANVAARLQSAAEAGTVLISADTYRLVHTQFDFRPRGAIAMKGKLEPVDSYEVTGVKAVPGQARGLEGLTSAMVGRDKEIALLRDRLEALDKGAGAVVAVVGEAGLGKSRLLAELKHLRDSRNPPPAWSEARAISYGQSIPYHPWRQLGRHLIDASEMDPAPVVRDKLSAFVDRLHLRQADMPFYEIMLAADTEETRLTLATLSGETVVSGVAAAVVNAVKAALRADGGMHPQIIVMDDLHWSDSATLELIAQVATLAAFEPLLMICVLRPDRRAPSWQLVDRLQASLGGSFARIDLEPLDAAASSELLGNLLQIEDLPESIRKQILERSEGNPFYLEEVLRSLIDAGQVVREGEHWRATRAILEATIPETLAGVLSARIDRLPESTKRVAQTAAVIGRVFQHRVLEQVCRAAPAAERVDHVEPHIAALSYEQLVRERARDPEREYIFKHALTCEAAYGLLLKSRRRDLHARTGMALESLFADRRDEFAAMLAHHFAEAEDLPRALDYSMRAAANARRLFAAREELEHRETIVKLLDHMLDQPPSVMIDAVIDWVTVRHRLNMYEGTLERLATAVSLARESKDDRRLGLSLSWTANIHMVTGFPSRTVPYLIESAEIAKKLGDEQLTLLPLFFGTWSLVDRDPITAAEKLQEVIDIARRHDMGDVVGHAISYKAIAYARVGRFDEARALIDEALEVEKTTNSPVKRADIHIGVAMALYDMDEIDEGLEHAKIGAELAFGARGFECACAGYFELGRGRLEQHRIEDALADLGRSLTLAQDAGFEGYMNVIHGSIAAAEFENGRPAAVERLKTAAENARTLGDDYAASVLTLPLGRSLLRLGRHDEARSALALAIGYFREKGMSPYLAHALDLSADLSEAEGKAEEAASQRSEAESLRLSIHANAIPPGELMATRV